MSSRNDIPVCVGDIISYDFYMYGINDTLICTITNISGKTINIRINRSDQQLERYKNYSWFYDEWKCVNPEYIFELLVHLAPKVPDINEKSKNRNVLV